MTTRIGIGFSQKTIAAQAAREAAVDCKIKLNSPTVNFAFVLCTSQFTPEEILKTINLELAPEKLIGCTAAGIIVPNNIIQFGVAVLAISSDELSFGIGAAHEIPFDQMREAGVKLTQSAIRDLQSTQRQIFILTADGIQNNNSLILNGVQEILGHGAPIIGGASCDDFHFIKSYQFFNNAVLTGGACGVAVGGPLTVALSSKHGWKPLGKPRTITKAEGNIIHEIDNKPALSLYMAYFGDDAKHLQASKLDKIAILFPMGIFLEDQQQYLLRNVIDLLNDGSIVCQGEVPEGSEVHIMIGNKEFCRQASIEAVQEIKRKTQNTPIKLLTIFESMSRLKLLGRSAIREIRSIQDELDEKTPIFGMYSYGEIASLVSQSDEKRSFLQNASISMLAIG